MMNCHDCRARLYDHLDGQLAPEECAAVVAHVAECGDCRVQLDSERALLLALRALPAPTPRPGYADSVLASVRRADTRRSVQRRRTWYALAASLMVGVGVALVLTRPAVAPPSVAPQVAETLPAATQPVRLVFRSGRDLTDVTIEVDLPDGVELVSHPGVRSLSWQTDLKAGPNLLELPVIVHGEGGVLTARLKRGDSQRSFAVQVSARDADASAPGTVQTCSGLAFSMPFIREVHNHV
jgi:anti-sigma factor RsiW